MKILCLSVFVALWNTPLLGGQSDEPKMSAAQEDSVSFSIEEDLRIGYDLLVNGKDSAAYHINLAIAKAKERNEYYLQSKAHLELANFYRSVKSDYGQAMNEALTAQSLVLDNNLPDSIQAYYFGMTDYFRMSRFRNEGNFVEAQELAIKNISVFRQLKKYREMYLSYIELALNHLNQDEAKETIDVIEEALEDFPKEGFARLKLSLLGNLARAYYRDEEYAMSLKVDLELLDHIYSSSDSINHFYIGKTFNNLSHDYQGLGRKDSAKKYQKLAVQSLVKTDHHSSIALIMAAVMTSYLEENNVDSAKVYFERMKKYADDVTAYKTRFKLLQNYVSFYKHISQFELALMAQEERMRLHEQIIDENNIKEQTEQRLEFEFEKERLVKANEIALRDEKFQVERTANQFLVLGLILVSVLVLTLFYIYRKNRKNQVIISSQNRRLRDSLEEKEILMKEIHHRVKNNLQLISSLLDLQSNTVDDSQVFSIFQEGKIRVDAISLIHQKLYQGDHVGHIDFSAYLEELISFYVPLQNYDYQIDCDNIVLDVDTAVPLGLVLNELITNAYKYAFKDHPAPQLVIHLKSNGKGSFGLTLSDNGTGLPAHYDWKKSKSLGLRLVTSLVKQMLGEITYTYENGMSTFHIEFKDETGRKQVA